VPYPSLDAELRRADALRAACGAGSGGRILAPPETLAGVPVAGRLRAAQGYPESLPPARMSRLLEAAGLAPATLLALDWERLARAHGLLGLLDVSCLVVEPGHGRQLADLGLAPGGQLAGGRTAYVRPPQGTAFVAGEPHFVESEDAALAAVLDPEFAPRRTVVLEGTDAPFAPAACADGGCAPGEVETVTAGPGRPRRRATWSCPRTTRPAGGRASTGVPRPCCAPTMRSWPCPSRRVRTRWSCGTVRAASRPPSFSRCSVWRSPRWEDSDVSGYFPPADSQGA